MYEIKPKKTSYILFVVIGIMALSAIGLGIGYAGAKLSGRTPEGEYIERHTPIEITETEKQNSENFTEQQAETVNSGKLPENEFMYLIRLENGKTKVYSLSGETPVYSHELPVKPGALPPDDVASLKEGIYLKNKDELLSFTEDFCS